MPPCRARRRSISKSAAAVMRPGSAGAAAANAYPRLESSCTSPMVQSALKSPMRVASRPPRVAPTSVATTRPVLRSAIWSSVNPRATQKGFVIGSIAEMSSLKSRAKRITAAMPGRSSSAAIGWASASRGSGLSAA